MPTILGTKSGVGGLVVDEYFSPDILWKLGAGVWEVDDKGG